MSLEADKLYYSAVQDLQAGRVGEAVDRLLELLRQHPDNARAHARLGELFSDPFKDLARAEHHFKQALAADSASEESHTGFAMLLILTERYAEATAHLNKAAAVRGARKDVVHRLFGMLHEAQTQLDDAVAAYTKAILATFSDDLLESCEKAIARCETKRKYL